MTPENYKKVLFGCKTPQEFAVTVQKGCTRCSLWEHGCGPIIYRGNPSSKILLLGESPGKGKENPLWDQQESSLIRYLKGPVT